LRPGRGWANCSLQWKDIRETTTPTGQTRQTLLFRAEKTKTAEKRYVPVGTTLAAILTYQLTGPDGKAFSPDAYVFGNAVGERVGSTKKRGMSAVLKAHGHAPQWARVEVGDRLEMTKKEGA